MEVIEDFESYAVGDINGTNGWAGDTGSHLVASSPAYEGSRSLNMALKETDMKKDFDFATIGQMKGWFYPTGTNIRSDVFTIWNGTDRVAGIRGAVGGAVTLVCGTTYPSLGTHSTNTWQSAEIEWTATHVRGRFNGGSWSSWVDPHTGTVGTPTALSFYRFSSGSPQNTYVDYIEADLAGGGGSVDNALAMCNF